MCFWLFGILSYLILYGIALSYLLSLHLEPPFPTSVRDCYGLWQLGIKSAFIFIVLWVWDRTLLAVGELPFPFCDVF